jgi:hypothetical protein
VHVLYQVVVLTWARKGTALDSILRDINREQGKLDTDVANFNRHYEKMRAYVYLHTKQTTIEWAKLVKDHAKALILIVETTHIVDEYGHASSNGIEPIRFTTLSIASGEIGDHLIRPTYSKGVHGTEFHGLSQVDLEEKPLLVDAWPGIAETLQDKHIIIYGADWACAALRGTHYAQALDGAYCLHNRCKEFYNEFYELSLEKVLNYQGIDKKREQLTDSRERIVMLQQIVSNLAAGMEKQKPVDDSGLEDLEEHPF